jgi:hypothetical protein
MFRVKYELPMCICGIILRIHYLYLKIFPEFVMILDCPQTALRKFELTEPTQYKKVI